MSSSSSDSTRSLVGPSSSGYSGGAETAVSATPSSEYAAPPVVEEQPIHVPPPIPVPRFGRLPSHLRLVPIEVPDSNSESGFEVRQAIDLTDSDTEGDIDPYYTPMEGL